MCLNRSAHGVVSDHEVFQRPYRIAFQWETIATPKNYFKFYNGRKLGKTMRAWRVQQHGYQNGGSVEPGVVAGGWGFEDAPDGEFLAGGVNTKGPRYPALGRHGPFLQWGFSAPPSGMTESGRQAFVNAICYIHKFDRQPPLTRTDTLARGYMLDRAIGMAKIEQSYRELVVAHRKRAADRNRAEAVKRAGQRELTPKEQSLLRFPARDPVSFDAYGQMMFRGHVRDMIDELGTSLEARGKYLGWYEQNLGFLYRTKQGMQLDHDAKAWGLANRDPAILRRAVSLLEAGQETERAQRILTRYTNQKFTTAHDWRRWLDAQGEDLFFSDVGGFRFYSSRHSSKVQRQLLKRRRTEAPTERRPVTCEVHVLGNAVKPGATVTVGLRMRIATGWHTYAKTAKTSPYPETKLELTLPKGATAIGPWDLPASQPSADDKDVWTYAGDVVFLRRVKLDRTFVRGGEFVIRASWQACDAHHCRPPAEIQLNGRL